MSKELIVMVGLPRSGKSTWVDTWTRNWREHKTYQIICADDIRLGLGTQFDRRLENFVWGVHDSMVLASLERGLNVIIDGCNTTTVSIKKYQDMAGKYDYDFSITYVDTSLATCIERNVGVGSVPVEVLKRMHIQLEKLLYSDFWHDLESKKSRNLSLRVKLGKKVSQKSET